MKNIARHISLIILLLVANWAKSQTETSSLLWKVEGENIQTSYLFGTIHLLPQSQFKLEEKVEKAFDESEQVVLEIDMDDPSLQVKMMQNAGMKDGLTLDKVFSEEDYELVSKEIQKVMGVGLAPLNHMKPFMLYSMLIANLIEGTPASFELTFVQMAKERELEILGLETVEEQMAVFDRVPYAEQAEDVLELVKDTETMADEFSELVETYQNEDIDQLFEITKEYADSETSFDELIFKRNKNWIPLIGEFAKEKSTFFGVGAGHLGGPEGVISLLREAGYQVTPVLK